MCTLHFTVLKHSRHTVQYSTRSSVTSVDNNYVFSLFLIPTYVRLLLIYKIFSAWATVPRDFRHPFKKKSNYSTWTPYNRLKRFHEILRFREYILLLSLKCVSQWSQRMRRHQRVHKQVFCTVFKFHFFVSLAFAFCRSLTRRTCKVCEHLRKI